ncbi:MULTISPECIES: hypothetical protein [Bacillus]|uniref:hypothetical protein n=1 Tax=Bacillus TaxID=1386 RepID=UPI0011DD15DD|nr:MULTISPECIES: hypothetical protein [Bacillus]
MNGYLSGGLASYSPQDNRLINFGGFGQTENMVSTDQFLYLVVYTKSVIYKYDPNRPFEFDRSNVNEAKNPKKLFSLDEYGQDRPFGMEQGNGKIYIGTVPSYGKLGGALTIYDEKTDKYEVYRNIVNNQSVVSLRYHDGLVYGSTSVFGGLGIKPTEEEAKVFIFDPVRKEKIYEGVPLPGEKAISTLEYGDKGNLWGMSPGKIFKFDIEKKKVIHSQELFPFNWKDISNYWRGADLLYVKDGLFYGVTQGNLFSYDSKSEKMKILGTGVSLIEADDKGHIFVTKGTKLYQLIY